MPLRLEHILPSIEQLDLAARQLEADNPLRSRFALLLCDNLAELLAHRRCEDEVAFADSLSRFGETRISKKDRRDALGQHFDAKMKFLCRRERIDEDTRDWLLYLHRFRNQAYHVGILHDDIVFELAWEYHRLACRLFVLLPPGMMKLPDPREFSQAARRHLPDPDKSVLINLEDAAASLSDARPARKRSLGRALSDSAISRLDHVEEGLEFLASDAPGWEDEDEEQVIRELQEWEEIRSRTPDRLINTQEKAREFARTRRKVREEWVPPVSLRTLARWRDRAEELAVEPDSVTTLKKFWHLVEDFEEFETLVHDNAAELDAYIQNEINRALGK